MSYYSAPTPFLSLWGLAGYLALAILIIGSLVCFAKRTTLPLIALGLADLLAGPVVAVNPGIIQNGLIALALFLSGLLYLAVGIRRQINGE